tara:strand:+ start:48 stop:1013 length:966 start_codon:yes stop_codon:yes gene_type:complete
MKNTNNNFVLNEVINDLIDAEKSLVNPLMKLNYFSLLVKNQELTDYTLNEINGYGAKSILPNYRKFGARLLVNIQSGYNEEIKEIPASMLEGNLAEFCKFIPVFESIKEIEKMNWSINQSKNNRELQLPLPLELLPQIQPATRKLYRSNYPINVSGAKLVGNSLKLLSIIEKVRTNLLAFSMKLGEEFGFEIEIKDYNANRDTNNQLIIQYMSTNITNNGDGNLVNTGDKAKIKATININKGNREDLEKHLLESGIDKEDTAELMAIVDSEEPNKEKGTFGEKVNNWTTKMLGKALAGTWEVGVGAAGSLIAEALKLYYGM